MSETWERDGAVVERQAYRNEGLNLVAWIIRPAGSGPFPMTIVNHGSDIGIGPDGRLEGHPERPTIDPDASEIPAIARNNILYVFPEGRGYGGSDGPDVLATVRRGIESTFELLQGRARDANAAADWAAARPDVDPVQTAISGSSHGGVVTLLAAALRPYGSAVAQATGAAYGHTEASFVPLCNAAARIVAPVLFQHMRTDTLVPMSGARHIFDWSSQFRPRQRWADYPGEPGVEGHNILDPRNWAQARADYIATIRDGFASGPRAPEDPPRQLDAAALLFLVPDGLLGSRWAGRFGAGVEAMLVLDGPDAIYAWKHLGSRGYARATVVHRGDSLHIEPWPGITLTFTPLPDNAFRAVYEAGTDRAEATLRPVR